LLELVSSCSHGSPYCNHLPSSRMRLLMWSAVVQRVEWRVALWPSLPLFQTEVLSTCRIFLSWTVWPALGAGLLMMCGCSIHACWVFCALDRGTASSLTRELCWHSSTQLLQRRL